MLSMRHVLARTLRAWLACAALALTFVPAPGLLTLARDVAVQTAATDAPATAARSPIRKSQERQALTVAAQQQLWADLCPLEPTRLPDPSREITSLPARYFRHCALLL